MGSTAEDSPGDTDQEVTALTQDVGVQAGSSPSPSPESPRIEPEANSPEDLPSVESNDEHQNNMKHKLHQAIIDNDIDGIKTLLDDGAPLEAEFSHSFCEKWGEDFGVTPLLLAADLGNDEIVQLLLDRRANKLATTAVRKATALFIAAWSGHEKLVEIFYNHRPEDLEKPDFQGRRPLAVAARNGHSDVVTFLVQKKADVNVTDYIDRTPLHYAASYGYYPIVETLLSAGANIHAKSGDYTALHLSAFSSFDNSLEVVKLLLRESGDLLNMKSSDGDTALNLAAFEGHLPVVKFLVESGAEINVKGSEGNTALHFAAYNGKVEVVEHLLDNGAEFTLKSDSGRTSLHMACYNGHVETCRFLLDTAAGLNDIQRDYITARDEDGDTALMDAISNEYSAIVFQILETEVFFPSNPAKVEPYLSPDDETEKLRPFLDGIFEKEESDDIKPPWEAIMYWALLNGNKGIFLECEANKSDGLNLKDWKRGGCSCAHVAAIGGNLDLVEYLFQEDLGTLAPNEDKISPFHLAVKHNHIKVVQQFVSWLNESPPSEIAQRVSNERRSAERPTKYHAVRDAILQKQHDGETSISLAAGGTNEIHRKLERILWESLDEAIGNPESFFQVEFTSEARLVLELAAQFERPEHEKYLRRYLNIISSSSHSSDTSTLHLAVHCRIPEVVWWLLSNGGYLGADIITAAQNIVSNWKNRVDEVAVVMEGILENPPPIRRQKAWRYEEKAPDFQHAAQFMEEPRGTVVDFLHTGHQAWSRVKRRPMHDIIYGIGSENIMRSGQYDDLSSIKRRLYPSGEEHEQDQPREEKSIKRKDIYQPKIEREDGKLPKNLAHKPVDTTPGVMEADKTPAPDVRWIHIHANDLRCAEELMVRFFRDKGLKNKDHLPWSQFVQKSWVQLPAGEEKRYMKPQCLFYQNKSDQEPASNSKIGGQSALYMPYIFWHTHTKKTKDSAGSKSAKPTNSPNHQTSPINGGPVTNAGESPNGSMTSNSQSSQKDPKPPIIHGPMTLDQYYYISLQDTSDRDSDQVLWRCQMRHLEQSGCANDASNQVPGQTDLPPASPQSAKILIVNQLWLWTLDKNTILTCTTKEADDKNNSFLLRVLAELKNQEKTSSLSVAYLKELILSTATGLFNKRDIEFFKEKRSPLEVYRDAILDVTKNEANLFDVFEKSLGKKGSEGSDNEGKDNQESQKTHQHSTARSKLVSEDNTSMSGHEQTAATDNPYREISRETNLLREVKDICDELNMLKNLSEEQEDVWRQIWKDGYNPGAIFTYDTPSEIKAEIEEMIQEAQSVQRAIEMLLDLKQKQANILEAEWTRQQSLETTKQGEIIMVFTVVTIVFLPASFLTSLLAINISDFPHVGDNVRFEGRVVFPIIFGVSIVVSGLFTLIAFNAGKLKGYPYMKKPSLFRSKQISQVKIKDSSATTPVESLPENSSAESQSASRPKLQQLHRRFQQGNANKKREGNAPNKSSYAGSIDKIV